MAINYTHHDYDSLVNRITDLYKNKEGMGEGYQGSTGQTLIQLLADITDGLYYKLERRSQENYTSTALLDSSIWAAVSAFGYRPRRNVSSTGRLLLELFDVDGNPTVAQGNIEIPYGKVITFDNVSFMPAEDYIIRPGESSIEINIIQGVLENFSYNFDEEPFNFNGFFEYQGDFRSIEEYSIQINSNQGQFSDVFSSDNGLRIRAISFADATDLVYDIRYTKNEMRIRFGDGTFGAKPSGIVNVSWIKSAGDAINIIKLNREFKFDTDVILDDELVTPRNEYTYRLTNISPVRGGSSHESIPEIRRNLPEYIRTNDRAVTNLDYEFWALRSGIGGLLDVAAYGEAETNRLIFTMNNVYLSYVSPDRNRINPEQEIAIRNYIDRVKVNTTHLVIKPADKIYLGVDVQFKRHPALPISNTQLYSELYAKINEYFAIERGSIGKGFQHSEFVEYIQNLQIIFNGISYWMTDFVKVNVDGVFPFEIPTPLYDVVISLDDYNIMPNDVWTITLDGQSYSVVVQMGDSVATLVSRMKTTLFENSSLMFSSPSDNSIRLTHSKPEGSFTVSTGSGNLANYTSVNQIFRIPRPDNNPPSGTKQIVPGSVKIVDTNGSEMLVDNHNGQMVGPSYSSSGVDYVNSRFYAPSIPAGRYYMTFQQNQWQNFDVTPESYIDIMPLYREGMDDNAFYFSKITLL